MKKIFFEKIRNFSALDERDCQAAWLFAHWGQFGRETRAWPDGADPPHFHMHIGKIGQFFKVWVFRRTNVGLCVDGPCKTAGHLQNTPGTPAIHFPLVAAGSQSALYCLGRDTWHLNCIPSDWDLSEWAGVFAICLDVIRYAFVRAHKHTSPCT